MYPAWHSDRTERARLSVTWVRSHWTDKAIIEEFGREKLFRKRQTTSLTTTVVPGPRRYTRRATRGSTSWASQLDGVAREESSVLGQCAMATITPFCKKRTNKEAESAAPPSTKERKKQALHRGPNKADRLRHMVHAQPGLFPCFCQRLWLRSLRFLLGWKKSQLPRIYFRLLDGILASATGTARVVQSSNVTSAGGAWCF